ncbi:MAG: M28 family peptidase [Thermoplasmatales archaeon]|nr:M28 family peptidase [Thermoplasmatales archaeon]
MKKDYIKIIGMVVIILILSSPLISSISNISIPNEKSVTISETILFTPDPKIEAAIELVTESLLREYLTVISVEIGPRKTQTYGAEEAAKYIYGEFIKTGLPTRYHYWEDFTERIKLKHFKYYKGKNVEATLEGIDESCEKILVFNAHYDSAKVSPGAVDDGTGTVAVMTAAYALSQFEFNRTIKFVTFSGEEIGLLGSKNYVRDLYKNDTEILVEFNADMVGYANTAEEGRTAYVSPSKDAQWIIDEIIKVNEAYEIGFDVKSAWNLTAEEPRSGSDFWDFILHGYEAVAFWQSGRGGDYFHTPEDTIDKVNFSYLTNMTKLMVASLAHMADIEVYYPDVKIGSPKRGRLYREDRAIKVFKQEHTIVFDDVLICAEVKPGDSPIEKVEFYYDGKLMYTDEDMPYQWRLNKISLFRKHTVEIILYDEEGRTASDEVTFRYINWNKRK